MFMPHTLYRGDIDGLSFRGIFQNRFKTLRTTVYFLMPMEKEKVAARALVPCLLCRATRKIPDYTEMGKVLSGLYGATLQADSGKMGDMQLVSVTVSGLADRCTLDHEVISHQLLSILKDAIFDPPLDETGCFRQEDFLQEQRQMLEQVKADYNDKRLWSLRRMQQLMCEGEPYALPRCGSEEDIAALTPEKVTQAWKEMLKTARVEIFSVGDGEPERICQALHGLGAIGTGKGPVGSCLHTPRDTVRRVTETDQVSQAKMVMGFSTGTPSGCREENYAAKVMCTLFGGSGASQSRLFRFVREEMSLCYYCFSRFQNLKGIMTVECGVEPENLAKAEEAILQQLKALQQGDFTEEELWVAKLSLQNMCRTVEDYGGGLENFYMSQIQYEDMHTPREEEQAIWQVTAEQVQQAAQRVKLDTVYTLMGGEVHEEN